MKTNLAMRIKKGRNRNSQMVTTKSFKYRKREHLNPLVKTKFMKKCQSVDYRMKITAILI